MAGPRVLVSVYPQAGHFHPLVATARALQRSGCDLLVATARRSHAELEAAGLTCVDLVATEDWEPQARAKLAAELPKLPEAERRAVGFSTLFARNYSAAVAEPLLEIARSWRPDALLCMMESLAVPLVGALLRVPVVVHGFGIGLGQDVLRAASAAVEPLWERHGLQAPADAGVYGGLFVDPCPPSLRPADVRVAPRLQAVRPAQYDGIGACPPLPERRPLVYVTLGTNANYAVPERLRATIAALGAAGVGGLITGFDPAVLGALPDGIEAHRFVPQSAVLARSSAVICHAGASSLLGALAHRLPCLLLPIGADQFVNARAASNRGAALQLDVTAPVTAIEAALRRVLHDTDLRQAAREIGDEIHAMPSADDAAHGIRGWLRDNGVN
jgi:UDP:flavonoid glycosyltransferase YjiC (YdhE family)